MSDRCQRSLNLTSDVRSETGRHQGIPDLTSDVRSETGRHQGIPDLASDVRNEAGRHREIPDMTSKARHQGSPDSSNSHQRSLLTSDTDTGYDSSDTTSNPDTSTDHQASPHVTSDVSRLSRGELTSLVDVFPTSPVGRLGRNAVSAMERVHAGQKVDPNTAMSTSSLTSDSTDNRTRDGERQQKSEWESFTQSLRDEQVDEDSVDRVLLYLEEEGYLSPRQSLHLRGSKFYQQRHMAFLNYACNLLEEDIQGAILSALDNHQSVQSMSVLMNSHEVDQRVNLMNTDHEKLGKGNEHEVNQEVNTLMNSDHGELVKDNKSDSVNSNVYVTCSGQRGNVLVNSHKVDQEVNPLMNSEQSYQEVIGKAKKTRSLQGNVTGCDVTLETASYHGSLGNEAGVVRHTCPVQHSEESDCEGKNGVDARVILRHDSGEAHTQATRGRPEGETNSFGDEREMGPMPSHPSDKKNLSKQANIREECPQRISDKNVHVGYAHDGDMYRSSQTSQVPSSISDERRSKTYSERSREDDSTGVEITRSLTDIESRAVLRSAYVDLVRHLSEADIENALDYLFCRGHLSMGDKDNILCRRTTRHKGRCLLDTLVSRGSQEYATLLEAFTDESPHLLHVLRPHEHKVRGRCKPRIECTGRKHADVDVHVEVLTQNNEPVTVDVAGRFHHVQVRVGSRLSQLGAELTGAQEGSVLLNTRFTSLENLVRFFEAFKSGALQTHLQEVLLVPELLDTDPADLHTVVTLDRAQFLAAVTELTDLEWPPEETMDSRLSRTAPDGSPQTLPPHTASITGYTGYGHIFEPMIVELCSNIVPKMKALRVSLCEEKKQFSALGKIATEKLELMTEFYCKLQETLEPLCMVYWLASQSVGPKLQASSDIQHGIHEERIAALYGAVILLRQRITIHHKTKKEIEACTCANVSAVHRKPSKGNDDIQHLLNDEVLVILDLIQIFEQQQTLIVEELKRLDLRHGPAHRKLAVVKCRLAELRTILGEYQANKDITAWLQQQDTGLQESTQCSMVRDLLDVLQRKKSSTEMADNFEKNSAIFDHIIEVMSKERKKCENDKGQNNMLIEEN